MPKRIAVIDIGSNSARLVIYQRTSRYGFHLICQQKSRVRIGEGAYERGGELQPAGIRRAFGALQSFSHTIREYKVRKVHCVATSALRDAPNRSEFVSLVRRKLGIDIKVISGEKEAFFGAIAAANLLPVRDGVTIDIGGGSADMALLRDGRVLQTISLNLGTVRIKELFTDRGASIEDAKCYIRDRLQPIPESFRQSRAVAIGGTARALSRAVIMKNDYPFDKIHAFTYRIEEEKPFFKKIIHAPMEKLRELGIKKGRADTIREGALIFLEILRHLGAETVITSGVGVREGVFLNDLLRNDRHRFPPGINPSIRSIKDRFDFLALPEGNRRRVGARLYELFEARFGVAYRKCFLQALDLCNIGKMLTIYKEHQHAFYIASQELNYGFSHEEMVLIAFLLRSKGDTLYYKPLYKKYKSLLPSKKALKWLCFIYTLTLILYENSSEATIECEWDDAEGLTIRSDRPLYLAHEAIDAMEKPDRFAIRLIDGCESVGNTVDPDEK
ncbi:Ppx/GppA phosphatase family protein [Nitratifractor sp.]